MTRYLVGVSLFAAMALLFAHGDHAVADPGDCPGAAADPARADLARRVVAERAENFKAYEAVIDDLTKFSAGRWVAIAKGKIAATGASLDEVARSEPDAAHRFVFEVGRRVPVEAFVGRWHGPHFAGPGLASALGVRIDTSAAGASIRLTGGKTLGPFGTAPFPRFPLTVGPPTTTPDVTVRTLDVFAEPEVLSPDIVLSMEDWAAMGLERFELPGEIPIFGGILEAARGPGDPLQVRLANVRVTIPNALSTGATVVAACPTFTREGLIAVTRAYDRYWFLRGDGRTEAAEKSRDGKWIVYAMDRVVAEGGSVEDALRAADQLKLPAYHRFVLQVPRGDALRIPLREFDEERKATINGVEAVAVRDLRAPDQRLEGPLLVSAESAARLCLELYEEGRDVVIVDGSGERDGMAAYAWETPAPGNSPRLRLLVWEAPARRRR